MLPLATSSLPDSPEWLYELKLDGYRAIGFKTGTKAFLRSRNNKDFTSRYPAIAKALQTIFLPTRTPLEYTRGRQKKSVGILESSWRRIYSSDTTLAG